MQPLDRGRATSERQGARGRVGTRKLRLSVSGREGVVSSERETWLWGPRAEKLPSGRASREGLVLLWCALLWCFALLLFFFF